MLLNGAKKGAHSPLCFYGSSALATDGEASLFKDEAVFPHIGDRSDFSVVIELETRYDVGFDRLPSGIIHDLSLRVGAVPNKCISLGIEKRCQ